MTASARARALGVLFITSAGVITLAAKDVEAQPASTPAPACTTPKTSCEGADGYYVSFEDKEKLVGTLDPTLKELRTCLDSVGGQKITPSVVIRFDENGKAATSTVEAPGYESQLCVARVVAKLASVTNPRETKVRCEYGCPRATPATPPPVPVPPPTASGTATAQPPSPAPPPVKPGYHEEKIWYGYQTLAADAVSIGLIVGGIGLNQGGLGWPGLAGFILATPIIHMAHGNVGPGFGSVAMRVLIPPTTLAIGVIFGAIVGSSGQKSGAGEFGSDVGKGVVIGGVVGFLGGVAICVGIDAGVFGYEKVKVEDHAYLRARQKPWFHVTPLVDVRPNHASVGVGGTF